MKKVYELKINKDLEQVMPQLQEMEMELLTKSLLAEGCRDPLVVWEGRGELVDGHNRYRICRENSIPFEYVEMPFEDETAAKKWIIRNQLARRNVPAFVRCELVLPLEDELKAEAKKRQGQRTDLKDIVPDLKQSRKPVRTIEQLAGLAGVSTGTLDNAKKLMAGADEETKEKLRSGELSIYGAYKDLKKKGDEILPGHTTEQILGRELMGYTRPSDDVYDTPPITTYGMMPAEDMECRGRAEMAHVKHSLQEEMEGHAGRVLSILRKMTGASVNEENIGTLKQIVMKENSQIMDWFDQMLEEKNEQEEDE